MTSVTNRGERKPAILVALFTVDFDVVLIQRLARTSMIEGGWTPGGVATFALRVEASERDLPMAFTAVDARVILAQRPTHGSVVETPSFGRAVAQMTSITMAGTSACQIHVILVATNTRTMVLEEGRWGARALRFGMAAGTARLVVAFDTFQPEAIHVLSMAEE